MAKNNNKREGDIIVEDEKLPIDKEQKEKVLILFDYLSNKDLIPAVRTAITLRLAKLLPDALTVEKTEQEWEDLTVLRCI